MPKKTVEKLEVKEIKTYQTSDGKIYDTEEAALEHERLLKNPEEWYKTKILELEAEIAGLHITIERLEGKILALESKKFFPSQPHPDVSPWTPYQQPFNPMVPSPKLPAQPGDVVFEDKDHYQRVIMQDDGSLQVTHTAEDDEKAMKDGKTVVYAGHKRVITPSVTSFDFDDVATNPLDNSDFNLKTE